MTAMAEVIRPVRFFNVALGLGAMIVPFVVAATFLQTAAGMLCGLALIVLSVPLGGIKHRYGEWSNHIF